MSKPYSGRFEFWGLSTQEIQWPMVYEQIFKKLSKANVLKTEVTHGPQGCAVNWYISADEYGKDKIGANDYQELSRRTQSTELSLEDKRRHALFGLCSEVGEIHSIFQHEYQGKPADKEKVIDECGDLLWFLCELCDSFFINLSDVMEYNINKLKARYPQGFDVERSERRHESEL